jgi:hypothetical protein
MDLMVEAGGKEQAMRIAIAGATGRIGQLTTAALERAGHQPVPVSRNADVDVYTGTGLDAALQGVHAVIDSTHAADLGRPARRLPCYLKPGLPPPSLLGQESAAPPSPRSR